MALNNASILDVGFTALVGAESLKMHAYSAFTLLTMHNTTVPAKELRAVLKARAANTGLIALNTFESYIKGIEEAGKKLRANLATDKDFLAIFDMEAEQATEAVRVVFEGLNVTSGGDIRLWSKCEGFEPLDKEALKRASKDAAAAKANDKAQSVLAAFEARNGDATISDMAPATAPAPVSGLAAILAAIATLGHDDALTAMTALNTHIGALDAMVAERNATAPASPVVPVTADDAEVHPLSAIGRVTAARKAKAA